MAWTGSIDGPFGPASKVEELNVRVLEEMYRAKCGVDLDLRARGIDNLTSSGAMKREFGSGDPSMPRATRASIKRSSGASGSFCREWRWEYGKALALTRPTDRLLEISCGRGYFLRLTEGRVSEAAGLELNRTPSRIR